MARIIDTSTLNPYQALSANDEEWVYNGLDCCVTAEIKSVLSTHLDQSSQSIYSFSRALQAPIMEMQLRGMLVDQGRRSEVLSIYKHQSAGIEKNLQTILREGVGIPDLNWNSPSQLSNLFYGVLGLKPILKRNANGVMAPTTNREALEKLEVYFVAEPICKHILALRDLAKKISFLEVGIDPDGRMRTSYNIAGTTTGRLSSSTSDFGTGTNQQNIDRELRSVFISDPGYKFCNIDLEQGDSRNLGALCWERFVETHGEVFAGSYLDACESGDLHTTVSRMARPHLPWTDDPIANRAIADTKYYRNDSYRDLDKKLGHGSNYIGQPATMAKHAKVPVSEVVTFQTNYFNAFKCIPAYHEYVKQELKNNASLTTLFDRRRFFFGRPDDMATIREAVAYCPQSMTADAIDTGMLTLWRLKRNIIQLLCQVHDSILFQYPEYLEDEIIPWAKKAILVRHILRRGREFVVAAEPKVGWNWGEFNEDKNPDGLIKWKGSDPRKRSRIITSLTIRGR